MSKYRMTLPAHLLGPSAQPRLDREAEAQSQHPGILVMLIVWIGGTAGAWVLVGLVAVAVGRIW